MPAVGCSCSLPKYQTLAVGFEWFQAIGLLCGLRRACLLRVWRQRWGDPHQIV